MKRKLITGVLFTIMGLSLLLTGCTNKALVTVGIVINQQPVGGTNVNQVTCSYTVNLTGQTVSEDRVRDFDAGIVDWKVYWKNDQGGTYRIENFSEKVNVNEVLSVTNTTSFAPSQAGMYLDKTFWVVFEIQDSSGKRTIESEKAVCTVR